MGPKEVWTSPHREGCRLRVAWWRPPRYLPILSRLVLRTSRARPKARKPRIR
jgi:hypothetical protein